MAKEKKIYTMTKENLEEFNNIDFSLWFKEFETMFDKFKQYGSDFKCTVDFALGVHGYHSTMVYQKEYKIYVKDNAFSNSYAPTKESILEDMLFFLNTACIKKIQCSPSYPQDVLIIKFKNSFDDTYETKIDHANIKGSYILYKYYDCGDKSFEKYITVEG
jgi:hypothetical protein